jgi:hypothetical protein
MKRILFSISIITLLTTTGCLISEGGRHDHFRAHGGIESHSEVIVRPPVVEVRPVEVIVR